MGCHISNSLDLVFGKLVPDLVKKSIGEGLLEIRVELLLKSESLDESIQALDFYHQFFICDQCGLHQEIFS